MAQVVFKSTYALGFFFCNPWLLQDNNVPADDISQHLDMNVEAFMQQETNRMVVQQWRKTSSRGAGLQ
jgi:hypothetical protein